MSDNERLLVAHLDPKDTVSEAYRLIRTNLKFSQVGGTLKTILLTSAGPTEGKSITTSNLAVTLAQDGYKVIVVECDLRKPTQRKIFGVSRDSKGLTNFLVGDCALDEAIITTDVGSLDLMVSGPIPPNPSELLGSNKMDSMMNQLKGRYDFVLLDSPPVVAVADAAVLATLVDGVVLVVRANKSSAEMIKEAKTILERSKAKIVGVVLNDVKIKSKDYNYYYYYRGKE